MNVPATRLPRGGTSRSSPLPPPKPSYTCPRRPRRRIADRVHCPSSSMPEDPGDGAGVEVQSSGERSTGISSRPVRPGGKRPTRRPPCPWYPGRRPDMAYVAAPGPYPGRSSQSFPRFRRPHADDGYLSLMLTLPPFFKAKTRPRERRESSKKKQRQTKDVFGLFISCLSRLCSAAHNAAWSCR